MIGPDPISIPWSVAAAVVGVALLAWSLWPVLAAVWAAGRREDGGA